MSLYFGDKKSHPPLSDALQFIYEHPSAALASPAIEEVAFQRIQKFQQARVAMEAGTGKCLQEQHTAMFYLPEFVRLLVSNSHTLAHCIQFVYGPDWVLPKGVRRKRKQGRPQIEMETEQVAPQLLVHSWSPLCLSRWLYAQLNFFELPADYSIDSSSSSTDQSTTERQGILLGAKLTFCLSVYFEHLEKESNNPLSSELGQWTSYEPVVQTNRSLLPPDDDLSWLMVSPDEVDDLLQQKQKEMDDYSSRQSAEPSMFGDVERFLNSQSGLSGVHGSDEESSETDSEFYSAGESDGEEGEEDAEIRRLMEEMDAELKGEDALSHDFEEIRVGDETVVDENLNLMKQFLSSCEEQPGSANALSNLLRMISNSHKQG